MPFHSDAHRARIETVRFPNVSFILRSNALRRERADNRERPPRGNLLIQLETGGAQGP
jgi:hypothetical protein